MTTMPYITQLCFTTNNYRHLI